MNAKDRLVSLIAWACFSSLAVTHGVEAAPTDMPLDYREASNWVCRSGSCTDDLTATVLAPDGSTRIEAFQRAENPKVDCFYVYPTVSHNEGLSAAPSVTRDERRAVIQQAARFASVCRLFVPLYRQMTVTSMLRPSGPGPSQQEVRQAVGLARADVLAAWDDYWARDNSGRGVVLIGHSQGAGILIDLIRQRLDGEAGQRHLVAAVLPGALVLTPKDREIGGTFKAIPPCRSDRQIGCVISFNLVRRERPIPRELIRVPEGQRQVCTNPASLGGGSGWLKPYLSSGGETIIPELTAPQPPWLKQPALVSTPFVTLPRLYEATCDDTGAYVSVAAAPARGDVRTGALTGDWIKDGVPEATMGLHLIDLNLAAGNLVEIIAKQAEAYTEANVR